MNWPKNYPLSPDLEDRTQPGLLGAIRRGLSVGNTLWRQAQYEYNQGNNARLQNLPIGQANTTSGLPNFAVDSTLKPAFQPPSVNSRLVPPIGR